MLRERARVRARSLSCTAEETNSLPSRRCDTHQGSEETVILFRGSSSKEQGIRQSVGTGRGGAMTELKCPETIDLNWSTGRRMKQTDSFKLTNFSQLVRIENMNTSIAEIANE